MGGLPISRISLPYRQVLVGTEVLVENSNGSPAWDSESLITISIQMPSYFTQTRNIMRQNNQAALHNAPKRVSSDKYPQTSRVGLIPHCLVDNTSKCLITFHKKNLSSALRPSATCRWLSTSSSLYRKPY